MSNPTCGVCGKDMHYNVPRLGEGAGGHHADGTETCATSMSNQDKATAIPPRISTDPSVCLCATPFHGPACVLHENNLLRIIESQRKELEESGEKWNKLLGEQHAIVAQVEAENVLLKRELEELREAKGLLPKCEVDQELFAANVTCRQQAKLIEYHEKTITDLKREIEDCVEGMAMQSALIKDLRKELADASVMISQLTGQYDNEVKELREEVQAGNLSLGYANEIIAKCEQEIKQYRELCGELVATLETLHRECLYQICPEDDRVTHVSFGLFDAVDGVLAKAKERLI